MLVKYGGAEKVIETFREMFPKSDLYTLLYDERKVGEFFPKSSIHSTCFSLSSQRFYAITRKQRLSLPLMKRSVEALNLSSYDLVIISSSSFAHRAQIS